MSDEPPPSPLRLRPRPRPESETPPAASPEGEEAKLRLKPKLSAEPEVEAPAEPAPVEEETPVAEPPRLKPKLSLAPDPEPEPAAEPEPAPEAQQVTEEAPAEFLSAEERADELPPPPMPEEGKIKLKIKLPGAAAQEAAPAEGGEETGLPPFPVVAPPPGEEQVEAPPVIGADAPPPLPPRTPGLLVPAPPISGSRPAVFKRPRVPAALVAAERRKRMLKYFAIAIGGAVLAVVVISTAIKLNPPAPVRVPPAPVVVPRVEPKKIPVPEKAPVTVEPQPVEPVPTERVATTATVEISPGVTATTESIKAVPNASPAFRTFVASAKISGVYQGTPARAFINGRLVRAGEVVDEMMEIQFDSVDQATRSIIFKDSTGATVSRRY